MTDAKEKPLIGKILQETYTIERQLGQGGMGAVYEASHLRLRRRFAIKLLHPGIAENAEAMARFRREAEATSGIGHPSIIEVIDFNKTDEGAAYIVMELLDGEDLESVIEREGKLDLMHALAVFYQTASALGAAHDAGVIHRDLKPPNIFICSDSRVKIVDFGISKVLGSHSVMTQTHATMGTPSYMSPEQAEGRAAEVDARTDVFALGTILYEMLSGRPPFLGDSIPTVLYKIVHQDPPQLSAVQPDLPPPFNAVVVKALSKNPEDRYATMSEFAAAVDRAAATAKIAISQASFTTPGFSGANTPQVAADSGRPTPPASKLTTLSGHTGQLEPELRLPTSRGRRLLLPIGLSVLLIGGGLVSLIMMRDSPEKKPQPLGAGSTAGASAPAMTPDAALKPDAEATAVSAKAVEIPAPKKALPKAKAKPKAKMKPKAKAKAVKAKVKTKPRAKKNMSGWDFP